MMLLKITLFCGIWCNAMCLHGLRFKEHIIFHILYIIVPPLCSAFLKHVDFYKAHRSENRGVLWLPAIQCIVWLAEYLKHVMQMLRPLPCCDAVSRAGATRLKQ